MADITVNSRLLGLKDVRVHVEDTGGDGRPVVLIHGWPLSGDSWKAQVPVLQSAGYRVVTYDRRGFGRSDKPSTGYDYDTLTDDLAGLLGDLDLERVTLVGFSMGGGEVARYVAKYGEERLQSVVFAAAIPPMMMRTSSNPDGPLDESKAAKMETDLALDERAFYEQFIKDFFSPDADGNVMATDTDQQDTLAMCEQADKTAALAAMQSFGITDFRDDLSRITVPTLVLHGDADGIVSIEGSGHLTHEAVPQSTLHVISGGPHGINVTHAEEFNQALLDFLRRS